MLHGYARVLIGELRALQAYIPPSPHMSSRGPIIPPGETKYMLASLGPPGVGVLLLRLHGHLRTQGTLLTLQAKQVLPLTPLQVMVMMMTMPTSFLGVMILSRVSFLL